MLLSVVSEKYKKNPYFLLDHMAFSSIYIINTQYKTSASKGLGGAKINGAALLLVEVLGLKDLKNLSLEH